MFTIPFSPVGVNQVVQYTHPSDQRDVIRQFPFHCGGGPILAIEHMSRNEFITRFTDTYNDF